MSDPKKISIFGSARPRPGDAHYQLAYRMGQLLAQAGYVVLTGGYMGTMEAASRGAAEQGGHVIGVTCDEIEAWRPIGPNAWVHEEHRHATLRDRLNALVDQCDAALALPGGVGTLAEVASMWSGMQTKTIPLRPLIFVGAEWEKTLTVLFEQMNGHIPEDYRNLVTFAPSPENALSLLINLLP